MINLARPKQHKLGWFVAEDVGEGFFADYLHTDRRLYPSTNNAEGKCTGYFISELEAYKAIYDFCIEYR